MTDVAETPVETPVEAAEAPAETESKELVTLLCGETTFTVNLGVANQLGTVKAAREGENQL